MDPSLHYKSGYRSEIDGLRAFAVLSVVVFHAFPTVLHGGFIGVDVFFVISGFLITSHIFENLKRGEFSFTDFFARRVRRIFPALIIVMFCCLGVGWFTLLADEYAQLGKHVASGTIFVTNFVLVDESGYFDNAAETKPMLHLWSLAVEEQFYIFWPLVIWFAWKRNFNLLKVTLVVAATSFLLNLLFVQSRPTETFFWPLGRFWELLSGSVLAYFYVFKPESLNTFKDLAGAYLGRLAPFSKRPLDNVAISNLIAFLGFFLLIYGLLRIDESLPFPSMWAILPVVGALLVIMSGANAWLNRVFLTNRVAIWFGLISYPLYLWHWPILSFLRIIEGEVPSRSVTVCAIFLSVFLAWLTYKFIERPIRKKSRNAPKVKHLVVTFCLLGVSAFYVHLSDGIHNRAALLEFNANLHQLKRTEFKEESCLRFLSLPESRFDYCKVSVEGSKGSVAVIGDSHAHAAFPGISEGLSELGFTAILMANSACPPLIGSPWGRNQEEKDSCSNRIEQIISKTRSLAGLHSVIIFSRGPTYWLGDEPSSSKTKKPTMQIDSYFRGLQRTVDTLSDSKDVEIFYVTENPELKFQARSCLPRPLNTEVTKKCDQNLDFVLERQEEYRTLLRRVEGLTILDSINAFCNLKTEHCFAFSPENKLLYSDDDHLSVFGSTWQYKHLIKPHYDGNLPH